MRRLWRTAWPLFTRFNVALPSDPAVSLPIIPQENEDVSSQKPVYGCL